MTVHVTKPNPVAPSDLTIVPGGRAARWQLRSLRLNLVTSAVAQNRFFQWQIRNGDGTILAIIQDAIQQTASADQPHYWLPGTITGVGLAGITCHQLPESIVIEPEWTITLNLINFDIDDKVKDVVVTWDEKPPVTDHAP